MIEHVSVGQSIAADLVIAQTEPGVSIDVGAGQGLVGGAVSSFATTLVFGAIMIAIGPEYTERMMAAVLEDPAGATLYGLVALVGSIALIVALFVTIIGFPLAVGLGLLSLLLWGIGSAIAYLAIAERLVGREDGWMKPLFVAAAISGGLALSGIGAILSFVIGAAGFGTVLRDLLE